MSTTSKTILFFGNERLATAASTSAPVLKALVKAGYKVTALIASHEDPISHQKRDLEIGPVAHASGIPVILTGKTMPLKAKLKGHEAQAAVLVAFGKMVPEDVISAFPNGIINIHPSLLPKLRGPTPLESAILDGLSETGVTLMKLAPKMDAGPIYAQQQVALNGHETKLELAAKLNQIGAELLIKNLEKILNGTLKAKTQDDTLATYTKLINKADGIIDWQKAAVQIEREVRAYAGWPGSRTKLGQIEVTITKVKLTDASGQPGDIIATKNHLSVVCGQAALEILKLKPSGKNEMDASAFLAGYKDRILG